MTNVLFKEFYESNETIKNVAIEIDVTNNCQLGCIYCYFGEKGHLYMNIEKSLRAYTNLVEIFKNKAEKVSIHFMGGEPLLFWEGVTKFQRRARKIAQERGLGFRWSLTSNLIALTSEKAAYIKENGGRVHCSIDGNPVVQLHNRPHKKNINYINQFEDGIRNALTVPTSDFARVTVTPFSAYKMVELSNYLWGWGFNRIGLFPAANLKWSEADINAWRKNLHRVFLSAPSLDSVSTVIGERRIKGKDCNTYCGAGKGLWSIDINGNIVFCHTFTNNPQIPVINGDQSPQGVFADILNSTFPPNPKLISEGCLQCEIFEHCAGGCWANSFKQSGKSFKPDSTECKLRRAAYKITKLDEFKAVDQKELSNSICQETGCRTFDCDDTFNRICESACNSEKPSITLPIKPAIEA